MSRVKDFLKKVKLNKRKIRERETNRDRQRKKSIVAEGQMVEAILLKTLPPVL